MIVGVPKETFPGENRVALTPASIAPLKKAGIDVLIEPGAGLPAGIVDADYLDKGASFASSRSDLFARAEIILQVRALGANPDLGLSDLDLARPGQSWIAMCEPLADAPSSKLAADRGIRLFSLELIPRITRAQSMDVLSSMAMLAGYKAVLLAADSFHRMFPMMITAAGTVPASKVFVIGAGVAGLQAIATAKRLGAVVEAYDVRPAVKEQVQSVGGRFVELPLETGDAQDKGGYAKAQGEDFYRRQRELMAKVIAANDVVITTAVVPGKKAPILVTADMVRGMKPGSVVVDLAAERGGNCELTEPGKVVVKDGVTLIGPLNIPSTLAGDASQLFSKNVVTFLSHLVKKGVLEIKMDDEITRETLVTDGGQVVLGRVRDLLGLAAPAVPATGTL
ncbi:Re/Si-specific NAD(P)(+) transhydrogenase subunit alpha [bacterium]|nr:Re/Si-specific NAD(P)(+) transhydrogenase subunit alpha [bacterium]